MSSNDTATACPIREIIPLSPVHEGYATYYKRAMSSEFVQIYHPVTGIRLFVLPSLDGDGTIGVHYGTVHTMCGIICGNKWGGVFRNLQDGTIMIDSDHDSVLPSGRYNFFPDPMAEMNFNYPVVRDFNNWMFPHGNMPSSWSLMRPKVNMTYNYIKTPGFSIQVKSRDQSCLLSAMLDGTEAAYLVPVACLKWFVANEMGNFCSERFNIDDPANGIRLRSDLHRIFDHASFSFVPKISKFVAHVITKARSSTIFCGLWQNVQPYPFVGIPIELLLARFAWAVFSSRQYISDDRPEAITIKVLIRNDNLIQSRDEILAAQGAVRSNSRARSASRASAKRQKTKAAETEDEVEFSESEDDEDMEEYEPRGRRSLVPDAPNRASTSSSASKGNPVAR